MVLNLEQMHRLSHLFIHLQKMSGTSREGCVIRVFNNVKSKPGIGYPQRVEKPEKWKWWLETA